MMSDKIFYPLMTFLTGMGIGMWLTILLYWVRP